MKDWGGVLVLAVSDECRNIRTELVGCSIGVG